MEKSNKNIQIHNIIRMLFSKIGWYLIRKTCKHEEKEIVFEDHSDRYTQYRCNECKSDIYIGWD